MYVSNSGKFVFLHINKTGGRTVKYILRKAVSDIHLRMQFVHVPYRYVKKHIPSGFKVITNIRNPFQRYESLYSYRLKKGNKMPEFNEWLWEILSSGPKQYCNFTQTQFLYPFPENMHLVKLENLKKDLPKFIGISCIHVLPHLNKAPRAPIVWDRELARVLYDLEEPIFKTYYPEEVKP